MWQVILHAVTCIQVPGPGQVFRQVGEFYGTTGGWHIWQPVPQIPVVCHLR